MDNVFGKSGDKLIVGRAGLVEVDIGDREQRETVLGAYDAKGIIQVAGA